MHPCNMAVDWQDAVLEQHTSPTYDTAGHHVPAVIQSKSVERRQSSGMKTSWGLQKRYYDSLWAPDISIRLGALTGDAPMLRALNAPPMWGFAGAGVEASR